MIDEKGLSKRRTRPSKRKQRNPPVLVDLEAIADNTIFLGI